jgi:hypothetical protein
MSIDHFKQPTCRISAKLTGRLSHGSQRGIHETGGGNIVESNNAEIGRHSQSHAACSLKRTDSHAVIQTYQRSWSRRKPQQLFGTLVSTFY